ncbi:MAG TPA: tetratricopeptide repeat protein [Kofleriaceae bacterium]|nr:tetratricopeptide repeat protein [Kofleriaceae bacterium]
MADLFSILAVLEHDPDDSQALESLAQAARATPAAQRENRLAQARNVLGSRGRSDAVLALLDAELASADDRDRKADLQIERGLVLDGELLDVAGARAAFRATLELRRDDAMAKEGLEEIDVAEKNWQKFAAKFVEEAQSSTDRSLATQLYVSAAEAYVRFAPDAPEAEQYLKKALEIEPRNGKAAFHLARLYRRAKRTDELLELLDARAEKAGTNDEKIAALIALSELVRGSAAAARGDKALRRLLQLDPTHPRALRFATDAAASAGDWPAVVAAYQAALRARTPGAGDDVGMLLQIAMVLWKHVGDLEQAEEYFRRIRKVEATHPAALDFYRSYYTAKGETGKLMTMLKQVQGGSGPVSAEVAELAEAQNNPEKAIEAWKQHLRADPTSQQARAALQRLYRKTEKWNALLDLMKDEVDRLADADVASKVARLFEVAEIYRDRLKLDVMVINTYNAILKLDPENARAGDELAAKFRALGRWNDLIAVLTRKSEAPNVPDGERVKLLREVADLWTERFGNFANAIKPLEKIAELAPRDVVAVARLKEIYTKRRQWRQLIDILGKEARASSGDDRRGKQSEMARLAAERLGDTRLAIEIYNRILGETPAADAADTLASLASLYDREKRHLAFAEMLHRQVALLRARGANKDAIGLLEKLGQVYAERLTAPQQAAAAWQEILELEPNHAKALRTLRELYAVAGDFAGLEQLYARLGQEDELVDALLAIADRIDGKDKRLPLVERAAQLAQKRADANPAMVEKARATWERVLAVESQHVPAAIALAPIYEKQEKWTRLLTMREIELGGLPGDAREARLAKIAQIRQLCEQKLASKTLAFTWALRAFELDPKSAASTALYDDVMRLASEPDQWRDVVAAFERALGAGGLTDAARLKLYRELARIAQRRLNDVELARGFHRKVLEVAADDRESEAALEDLASHVADWSELLASFRKRAMREQDPQLRAKLLVEAAGIQEQKLVDLDGASVTYKDALRAVPGYRNALRALAKVEEARGDWESLAEVLAEDLKQTPDGQPRFDLLMRLGSLEEHSLERPAKALAYYKDALAIPAPGGSARPAAVEALARLALDLGLELGDARVPAVKLVLPHLEANRQSVHHAQALEILRASAPPNEQLELDRALMRLYHVDLGDPAAAWTVGLRVIGAAPGDASVRAALAALAAQLGRDGEWARHLGTAMLALQKAGGQSRELRAAATELAHLAGERLGDRATAERAWLAVLEVEHDAPDAFDALIASYRADQRWVDLRNLLERRVAIAPPPAGKSGARPTDAARLASLMQLAVLEEQMLADATRAIAAYRRALELDPGNADANRALDRLYAEAKQWPELEALLARQVDFTQDHDRLVELAYRRAVLFAHELGEPGRAVDLLEDVLARRRSHADGRELLEELLTDPKGNNVRLRVARILEPLYERDKLWKDLGGILRVLRTMASGTEAALLLARLAQLEETELGSNRNAFEAWLEVLKLEPADERARIEIPRLAQWLQRWPEAMAALEAAVDATSDGDVATRAALLGELATYYDTQLGDAPRAITAYRRLLEADLSSPATTRRASAALARLYEESQQWPELRGVIRRQAEWAEDMVERRALLGRVAVLEEEQLRDRVAAIATWHDVLHDQPTDPAALHALERLHQASEQWRELIDVLRRMIDAGGSAIELLSRIAEIDERKLGEPDEAIAAWLEVLDHDAHNARSLAELARLYRAANRHADLLDVYERQAAAAHGDDAIALHVEIAKLLGGPLARPTEALDRWDRVLQTDPQHPEALSAVEAALADHDLRVGAADILRPVYAASAQDERIAQLSLRQAEWTDDPGTKLRALTEVVMLREHRLGDKAGAFAAQLQALRYAASEPELAHVVAETERLAGELGREADLIDAYRAVAPDVLDAEIQRRLYLDIADLSRAVRRDLELSREFYQKVLDVQPDDRRALAALESIYRETGDDARLVEILLRQGSADLGASHEEQVSALSEAANLYIKLGRTDDAITTWESVLELAPERGDVIYALESLYGSQGRWHDIAQLYERRLGFVTSMEEAVALRVQLGELYEKHIHDIEAAVDNYAAALGGNMRQPLAIAALERLLSDPDARPHAAEVLEPMYVAAQRWNDLVRVYEAKLDAAADPADRLKLTRFVARLYEEQLEDFENATRWYARVFREAPSEPSVRDQLQRLATMGDHPATSWGFVAQTYQSYLDDESGESRDVRDVAIAAAAIYDRRLGDIDRAYAAYRRALAIDVEDAVPNARELVRRLEELLGRAQRWNELAATYDDVVGRTSGDDDELRIEALTKRARLLEDGLQDTARAVDGWREVVLATDSGDSPAAERAYRDAVGELERLFRMRAQWHDLVDLLEARLGRTEDHSEMAELRLKLASLYESELQDLPAAIDQFQEVLHGEKLWERGVSALERLVIYDEHRARVIELLEPVYRAQDWWQKLVVILDAKLEYVHDPADQVQTLHEIAQIHEQRGGAIDMALAALARAWRIDVADDEALTKLLALAGKLGAWDEAARTVEDGAAAADNGELAAGLWARAAEIHENQRNDLPRAIAAWRKVDDSRIDDVLALAALDRLLAVEGRVADLVQVVARRAELSEDAGVRLVLLHRVAALYEEVLGDAPHAIAAYKNVLSVDDTDLAALDALERLYAGPAGDPRELAVTLERKIELTSELPARQALRHAAAGVYETQLDDVYQAIGHLTAVIDDDANDPQALGNLDRIYAKQKMWPELLDVVDKRALLAPNTTERADLALRAGKLVELELSDPDAAIPRYGAVLGMVATHVAAREALEQLMQRDEHVAAATPILERVYRAEREAPGLIRVYERRLATTDRDPVSRRADWQALADTREQLANQPAQAFVVWGRALADDPDDADLLQPLMRLAESQGLWRELAALLDERLADSRPLPPDVDEAYAMRLGAIAEERLTDLDRAARAFDRATNGPEPRAALAALERVLAKANKPAELAGVLRRQAEAADGDIQSADYRYREGDLQETALRSPTAAIAAYRDVLGVVPTHAQARAALERMLDSAPGQRHDIVDILEPLFEADGDAARLVRVLEARLAITPDAIDRAAILQRLVELHEVRLGDRNRALDASLRWLAADAESQQALGEVDRLAGVLGIWREVADRLGAIVRSPDLINRSPDVQVALLVFLGKIQRERLGQNADAIATYRGALELEPDALIALDPLIAILRQHGDWRALAEALRKRGKIAHEPAERRAAFAEVADLAERGGDRSGAVAAWREIAGDDETDRDALAQLARIYRATPDDKSQLIDTLQRAARFSSSPDDEKPLRIEIAQLETDGPRAVGAWQGVVDLDPEDLAALGQLEAAHARAGDWIAVGDIQTRRLDLAKTTQERVGIYAEMARLAEARRHSIDDAITAWYSALDCDNTHQRGYDELERLLAAASRWHDLVELLERRAELYASLGDGAQELATLARAADVWESKLDNPDAAGEVLEKILAREPGSVAALTRLSKIYERSGDWDKCKATLEQALQLQPQGRDAADLFYRLGEVARVGDSDEETAIQHFQQALRYDATHGPSIAALEKLARERRDSVLLADMLQRRLQTTLPGDRLALLVELAELERKAGRTDAALAALAQAANSAPDDVRVLGPLADMFFATGRLDEAAPIYDQLATDAKAARRMKDVAKFRQRQGGILEARGDRPGALAAYEEALRVNPTDVVTMTGLGRLYFTSGDWEKARKIYQSLVLQNIDAEIGVTKGEVYWALGKIHIELGQAPKAKSMFQRGLEIEPGNQKLKEALTQLV